MPAPDAVVIDSTSLSLEEVLARVESVITERLRGGERSISQS